MMKKLCVFADKDEIKNNIMEALGGIRNIFSVLLSSCKFMLQVF